MSRRTGIVSLMLVGLLVGAVPAFAVAPPGEQLPDGDVRPVIRSVELLQPASHNVLLEADLLIEADDNDGIERYEYRWNGAAPTAIEAMPVEDPVVSYDAVLPDTRYGLQVRAVDVNGWESEWYPAWTGVTPSPPTIFVAGDSIASGYSRMWFTGDATCTDAAYSFGSTVRDAVAAELPVAWAPRYANVAFPGAGVGAVLNGGSDSCSATHGSQIEAIAQAAAPTTWNIVVMTAGINSTNWVDVVKDLTRDTAFSLKDSGDKEACEVAVTRRWNLDSRRSDITAGTAAIVDAIETRTNASVYWASYFAIDGSLLAPGWSPIGPECEDEMRYALGELHGAIQAGLDGEVTWVDLDAMHVPTQMWAGWPHPSVEGHREIGLTIAEAIVG